MRADKDDFLSHRGRARTTHRVQGDVATTLVLPDAARSQEPGRSMQ
jgi:hypothetical protein